MVQLTTLELQKENFKFSAGHFTIFSATERENLHGHNWNVALAITAEVGDNGLTFDYAIAKRLAEEACLELNEKFLLPTQSPFLKVIEEADEVIASYSNETLRFLPRDIYLMPLRNITVEELARWFLGRFCSELTQDESYHIHVIEVKVYSGPGQSASAKWEKLST
ncbi:MAG: 6-carboxytetrahydropterin synthase [Verrucomicrobiota bacterium]